MRKKRIVVPLAIAAIAAVTAISATTAFAAASENTGMPFGGGKMKGEDHSEIIRAMESGDYQAWKSKIQEKVDKFTSEENFNQMNEVHQLMKDGKVEEATDLAEEFGLPGHFGQRAGMSEMREAVANNDYETWQQLMEEKLVDRMAGVEEKINQETFDKLVEAHGLMEAGQMDEAKELMKDAGLPFGGGQHKRGGGMFGHRFDQ